MRATEAGTSPRPAAIVVPRLLCPKQDDPADGGRSHLPRPARRGARRCPPARRPGGDRRARQSRGAAAPGVARRGGDAGRGRAVAARGARPPAPPPRRGRGDRGPPGRRSPSGVRGPRGPAGRRVLGRPLRGALGAGPAQRRGARPDGRLRPRGQQGAARAPAAPVRAAQVGRRPARRRARHPGEVRSGLPGDQPAERLGGSLPAGRPPGGPPGGGAPPAAARRGGGADHAPGARGRHRDPAAGCPASCHHCRATRGFSATRSSRCSRTGSTRSRRAASSRSRRAWGASGRS